MIERHIDSLRIWAFASGGIDFTEKENTHFDACRICRLKLIDALRDLAEPVESTTTPKAA
jgi:hypothetical protein